MAIIVLTTFFVALLAILAWATLASGAAGTAAGPSADSRALTLTASVPAPDRSGCSSARKGLRWYRGRYAEHRAKMGAGTNAKIRGATESSPTSCPRIRYLAERWRAKAYAARVAYLAWWARTPKLSGETWRDVRLDSPVNRNLWRLAVCETGGINGGEPLWTHHNSVYSGALGFAHSTWAHWRHFVRPLPGSVAARATAAEQLAVGRALVRTFGGYSPWPSCHRRLGLG